jgi:hypothetical protein
MPRMVCRNRDLKHGLAAFPNKKICRLVRENSLVHIARKTVAFSCNVSMSIFEPPCPQKPPSTRCKKNRRYFLQRVETDFRAPLAPKFSILRLVKNSLISYLINKRMSRSATAPYRNCAQIIGLDDDRKKSAMLIT